MAILTADPKNMIKIIVLFSLLGLLLSETLRAQPTCQPTSTGSNSIGFDSSTKEYLFNVDGQTLYKYSINGAGDNYHTGATFVAIKAKSVNDKYYWPSYGGGICAKFGNIINGAEIKPWEGSVQYELLENTLIGGSNVMSRWRMIFITDTIEYTYRFHISGKTLVIQVEVDRQSKNAVAVAFDFARCETDDDAVEARFVRVPYLSLFNVLYCCGKYTSLFCDWEVTNASLLYPKNSRIEKKDHSPDPSSVVFATPAVYLPKTDGSRNILEETIYLTVSTDLFEVLPNLPGPEAPCKASAVEKNVLSYHPPFPWLLYVNRPTDPIYDETNSYNYKYLDSLKKRGVNDLNVIIKNYQQAGFDHELPKVLTGPNSNSRWEPNVFRVLLHDNPCGTWSLASHGGDTTLQRVRNLIVDTLQYGFALHEQYVDYYPGYRGDSGYGYAKNSNSTFVGGWKNCDLTEKSHTLKPTIVQSVAQEWSSRLNQYHPTWSYLDVHSSANPSDKVDYDASVHGAGTFTSVLQNYRNLPSTLRNIYGKVAIQGEGQNHFLYVGYYDDFESRIRTGDQSDALHGYRAPVLVDFDLYKMHSKSAFHGVGHFFNFYDKDDISYDEMLTMIATELAYGHGGLVTKGKIQDNSIAQAVIEYQHVLPVYQKIADKTPIEIMYCDSTGEWRSASEYIKLHSGYDDISRENFMSQVKVKYANGITVIVNRHPTRPLVVPRPGTNTRWYAYHANGALSTGRIVADMLTLPPLNGWVVCDSTTDGDPDQPALISPDNGAKNILGPTILRWKVSKKATQYTVHIHISDGDINATTPVTWYTIGNLPPGRRVTWSVTAINDGGTSVPSSPRSFITSPDISPH